MLFLEFKQEKDDKKSYKNMPLVFQLEPIGNILNLVTRVGQVIIVSDKYVKTFLSYAFLRLAT